MTVGTFNCYKLARLYFRTIEGFQLPSWTNFPGGQLCSWMPAWSARWYDLLRPARLLAFKPGLQFPHGTNPVVQPVRLHPQVLQLRVLPNPLQGTHSQSFKFRSESRRMFLHPVADRRRCSFRRRTIQSRDHLRCRNRSTGSRRLQIRRIIRGLAPESSLDPSGVIVPSFPTQSAASSFSKLPVPQAPTHPPQRTLDVLDYRVGETGAF